MPDTTTTAVDLTELGVARGGSRRLTGHLTRPVGAGPWPGVVVVHEALGVNDVMHRQAERMAGAGYLVVMPDLFSDGGAVRCLVPTFRAALSGHGRAFRDIAAARARLAQDPDCTGRIGIIGFCMGGSFALLAVHDGEFDAASVNYGRLPKELDGALGGSCPVVASYGARDRTLPGAARRLEASLDRLGIVHDVKEYPEAGHSFLNDAEVGPRALRPLMRVVGIRPHPESAVDAWRRIDGFFATRLKAEGRKD
ncbi:dienelactone hydrolase family protein [Streptomyces sp. IB201691-2A2]|uniref:dienelactone hydrolase family protein n=1 Tax=Streptomyces sp. IB201691-2A2 TaxID=2561920 RepID=UPI0011802515|nr:dienelactone hydrolase family protein [Streptomyces sp. IB201691-2A2]TRO59667.1 dienelactone hydrolase family protein [Streptomyces sp. IB201691-2A2]